MAFRSTPACERATPLLYHDVKEQKIRFVARTYAIITLGERGVNRALDANR